MTKVLVIGLTSNPGGMESAIMNYYRKANKIDFKFDFLCKCAHPAYENELLANGSKIFTICKRFNLIKFYIHLNRIFKKMNYDVLWYNECLLTNISFLRIAKKRGFKKIIIHSHNSKFMRKGVLKPIEFLLHKIHRLLIHRYATDFWSCSLEASKFFYTNKIMRSKRHRIVYNAIDVDKYKFNPFERNRYRNQLGLDDYFVVGNIGRLHFQKNQEFVIRTFSIVRKSIRAKLLIVGDGEDRAKLENLCNRLGISSDVMFLGVREDIPNLLSAMDAFIFPSLFEGFGIASLEAQTSGLYVYNSVNVPAGTKITDKVYFLPLDNINLWVNIIIENAKNFVDRKSFYEQVKASHFNIKNEISSFEQTLKNS